MSQQKSHRVPPVQPLLLFVKNGESQRQVMRWGFI